MSHSNPHFLPANSDKHCPECGAPFQGGRAGCESLFDGFRFQALGNPRIGAVHRLALDTYCMQHVETYCRSSKSYVAHLTGLCCGIERHGDTAGYAAIQRSLNGNIALEKPPPLSQRGAITIVDVVAVQDVEEEIKSVHEWGNPVWGGYS